MGWFNVPILRRFSNLDFTYYSNFGSTPAVYTLAIDIAVGCCDLYSVVYTLAFILQHPTALLPEYKFWHFYSGTQAIYNPAFILPHPTAL